MNVSQLALLYDDTNDNVEKQEIEELIKRKIHSFTKVEEWMSAKKFFITHSKLKSLCDAIDRSLGKKYTLYGLILITKHFLDAQVWDEGCYRLASKLLKQARHIDAGVLANVKIQCYFYKYIVMIPDYDKVREKLINLGDNKRFDLFVFSLVNTELGRISLLLEKLPPGHELLNYLLLRKQNLHQMVLRFTRRTDFRTPEIEFDGLTLTFNIYDVIRGDFNQTGDRINFEVNKIVDMCGDDGHVFQLNEYDVAGYLLRYSNSDPYYEIPEPKPVPCREVEWEVFANLYETVADETMKRYTEEEFCEICIEAFQKRGRKATLTDEERFLYSHVSAYIGTSQITLSIDEILPLKKYSRSIYRAFCECFNIEPKRNSEIKYYLANSSYFQDLTILNSDEMRAVYETCCVNPDRLEEIIL